MGIQPSDLDGVEENLARFVLLRARTIVPCLDSLTGQDRQSVIAILTLAANESPAPGMRRARSMSRNGTSITVDGGGSLFTGDELAALRALCPGVRGLPRGSFPVTSGLGNQWPEGEYSS